MTDVIDFPKNIKQLVINILNNDVGELIFDRGSYSYIYASPDSRAISLTMSTADRLIYNSGSILPIFEMNIPEGYVRHAIAERLLRHIGNVSDMLFLALQQDTGIGALSYCSTLSLPKPQPEDLHALLAWQEKDSAFLYLLNKYLLHTTLSGVQPKVMLSAEIKGSLLYPNLIAKTGDAEYPQLAENEYLCMSLAKACGLPVPNFYLSNNKELFIMERFDLEGDQRFAMEDFCVLSGRSNEQKYMGSYEMGAKLVNAFTQEQSQVELYWRYVVLSCLVGNADAHWKNFALLYHPNTPHQVKLSPLYDVVNTRIYPTHDKLLALKMNKSQYFPNKDGLLKFARTLNIIEPEKVLEEFADIISSELNKAELWENMPHLQASIRETLSYSCATKGVFVTFDIKRPKKRKIDHLLR